MEQQPNHVYFREEQRFALWMKAVAVVPVLALGSLSIFLWLEGSILPAVIFSALTLCFLLLAAPNFILKLVTTLDENRLGIRIDPPELPVPFLPPRERDVPLSDIAHHEARTYRALSDRGYWGRHFWGLATASNGDAYLYVMNAGPLAGRGVELQLESGERLLIGSKRAEALSDAITAVSSGTGHEPLP